MQFSKPSRSHASPGYHSDPLSSGRRLSFELLEDRRLLSSVPYPSPHRSWIQLGMVAYDPSAWMLAPTATVYGTTGNNTGYHNGDIVTLPVYTTLANITTTGYSITPASFQLTVVGGNVTAVALVDSGDYPYGSNWAGPVYPSNPVSAQGGSGTGLELILNWGSVIALNDSGAWVAQNIDWIDSPPKRWYR